MKPNLFWFVLFLAVGVTRAADSAKSSCAIPWTDIGAKAGADYRGDGLAVTQTASGARLHCVFQRLDGEATPAGLWLTSIVTNSLCDRFRVTAVEVGRNDAVSSVRLDDRGAVSVTAQTVRFVRPGLTEEYSVSMDGVRQDFIVEQAPPCPSAELVVKLAVTGARVEPTVYGACLVLKDFGRKIAYSRMRVADATGKELPARIEVIAARNASDNESFFEGITCLTPSAPDEQLTVIVNDRDAVYPVRIDPTFSDANWISMGGIPGANGTVYAAVVDGSGNLYIGGTFTAAGNTIATNIAQWNGSSWSALGSGMNNVVSALAVSGSTLYAGGLFTTAGSATANYIAQWNGSNWSALGSGMGGTYPSVSALAVSGSTLYAGGDFTTAGSDTNANNIAQWNGSSWSALGSGILGVDEDGDGPYVNALAVSGSTLYVGGDFTTAGGSAANNIAQWNGSSWSALGSGTGGYNPAVFALAVSGSTLYVGGDFTTAGDDTNANYIAQWNGSSWSALGSGMGNTVFALAVSGSTLYAGGVFYYAGGYFADSIAQWNGSSWSALGSGIGESGSFVNALAVSGSTLYAGGYFPMPGGSAPNYIAQWNGSSWSALGLGMNGDVSALAVSGSTLYAGGDFTTAGNDTNVNYIAQWNGSSWSALGSGIGGQVSALAVSGGTLYAGGHFTTAGGIHANDIAQWNGSSWSALGSGMNRSVFALAVSGSTLYAGGWFTTAGGFAANYIAQWNGSSWSALGSGISGQGGDGDGPYVNGLAVSGSTLYVGGDFTMAGGATANYIAQWNGSNWSALGSGVSGMGNDGSGPYISALAVSGGTLYAGGDFGAADGNTNATCIAQWDGSNWSALGAGLDASVSALAVSGGTLYAGGTFNYTGDSNVRLNSIAQWNGSSWSALGSGMGGFAQPSVLALAVSGGALFAGGDFTIAGTNVSAFAAMAKLAGTPVSLAIITTNAAFGFTNGAFGFDVAGPTGSNVVIQASTNLQTWIPLQTNLLGSGPLYFSNAATNHQRFYRAVLH